jgi:hypothetical protein
MRRVGSWRGFVSAPTRQPSMRLRHALPQEPLPFEPKEPLLASPTSAPRRAPAARRNSGRTAPRSDRQTAIAVGRWGKGLAAGARHSDSQAASTIQDHGSGNRQIELLMTHDRMQSDEFLLTREFRQHHRPPSRSGRWPPSWRKAMI